jgi:hypothetical protein
MADIFKSYRPAIQPIVIVSDLPGWPYRLMMRPPRIFSHDDSRGYTTSNSRSASGPYMNSPHSPSPKFITVVNAGSASFDRFGKLAGE